MDVCIIGGGITGLTYYDTLKKLGFNPIIFEIGDKAGGIWRISNYPNVSLQNTRDDYGIPGHPWPFEPKFHPTGLELVKYFDDFVEKTKVNISFNSRVLSAKQLDDNSWNVVVKNELTNEEKEHSFKYLVVATGLVSQPKNLSFFEAGKENFKGKIVTEQQVKDLKETFENKRVVVIGFGKSSTDMATLASSSGATKVDHVFRDLHWVVPRKIFGVSCKYFLFNRMSTVMTRSWSHPTTTERFLHEKLPFVVTPFWGFIQNLMKSITLSQGTNSEERKRIEDVIPKGRSLEKDFGLATSMDPEDSWFGKIARQEITPHHGIFSSFTGPDSINIEMCSDNSIKELKVDVVVICTGTSSPPKFPFLEPKYREMLEQDSDGVQLFHHMFHPRIQNFTIAGFNHSLLHTPSCMLAALYAASVWRGEMILPSPEDMEKSANRIREWKRKNSIFGVARLCIVDVKFQQYLDILCQDLQLSPWRKFPNVFAELLAPYGVDDYAGVVDEYLANIKKNPNMKLHWLGIDA